MVSCGIGDRRWPCYSDSILAAISLASRCYLELDMRWLENDPDLESLRDNERFKVLVERAKMG